jgi:hypothetical protein
MSEKLTQRYGGGVDALPADQAGQTRLNGCVEIDLALGDELQNRRGHKGFGDAGGANVGLRGEPGFRVDVGVACRDTGETGSVPDDDDAAGQVVAGNGLVQRVVDGGGGCCVGARAGQCEQKKNGTDGCDAH